MEYKNEYPDNWAEIAYRVKVEAGFRCERCGRSHNPQDGYMLGVHHLNKVKSDNRRANLAALCQKCHLHVEHISPPALLAQAEMFEPFEARWLKPHLEGLGVRIPDPRLRAQ